METLESVKIQITTIIRCDHVHLSFIVDVHSQRLQFLLTHHHRLAFLLRTSFTSNLQQKEDYKPTVVSET